MPGFAGFDRSDYPGDAIMTWLKNNTNLVWCGYYLGPAPSHQSTTWMTTRPRLVANGWGIAPVFVGQQVQAPGSLNPSAQTGVEDGNVAAALMRAEGFPPGAFVYLDLENGMPFPQAQQDYVASWCDAVTAAGFGAGVYCSHVLAAAVHNLRPACRIWAFRIPNVQPNPVPSPYPDSDPSGCGFDRAFGWQLFQNCNISVPPAHLQSLHVDLNSAMTPDPSAP